MSSKFNGFTQDEICTINAKSDHAKKSNGGTVRKHIPRKPNNTTTKNAENTTNQIGHSKAMTETIPAELSDSTIQAFQDAMYFRPPVSAPTTNREQTQLNGNDGGNSDASTERIPSRASTENDYNGNVAGGRAPMLNGISLKDFEKHQKVLKEANMEKRRLLSQAIEQKFEQSIAEATKIAKIREELDKLDQELAVDVEILRKEIEAVSVQYTNTRDNYHQIESQFLAAKLDLHQIAEKKELLTEHLCTIISHNENRKAQKLSELLDKVGLNTTESTEGDNDDGNGFNDRNGIRDNVSSN